jgi:hypothetical protein
VERELDARATRVSRRAGDAKLADPACATGPEEAR